MSQLLHSVPDQAPVTAPLHSSASLVLSDDQDIAAKRIQNFVLDPEQQNLILRGYAGTGKSTLLKHVIDSLPAINKLAKIVGNDSTERRMQLTATTNKAAGALRQTTGHGACTVHTLYKLRPQRDENTGKQKLVSTAQSAALTNGLLVIDEAYMADLELLKLISEFSVNTKILWVGDPAQLLPVGMNYMPLAIKGYNEVTLEKVIRQAENSPIIQLATLCRYAVETGRFFRFEPDGDVIQHVTKARFESLMLESFDAHNKTPGAVKTLAWTNRAAIDWNNHVKQQLRGSLEIKEGDYVVANSAVNNKQCRISTDQTVQITGIRHGVTEQSLEGALYEMDENHRAFMPYSNDEKVALLRKLRRENSVQAIKTHNHIEDHWIDLRDEYACTVNKSQGSTYGTTFIDLADIGRCNSINQLARLLYVAVSRPRDRIVFTGDIR